MTNDYAKLIVLGTVYFVIMVFSWLILTSHNNKTIERILEAKFKKQEDTIISIFQDSEFTINLIEN